MGKSITGLVWVALAVSAVAAPPAAREWREVRRQLEKHGVKVDHFAKTPAERARELAHIRRQLERANDPAKGRSMRSIGGAAASPQPPRRPSRLGQRRRL